MTDVDLPLLHDLLRTLRDMGTSRFQGYGIAVEFERPEAYIPTPAPASVGKIEQEPVQTRTVGTSVWEDPSLWPGQGGKRLRFDGKLG